MTSGVYDRTPETRAKMSRAHRGKVLSAEHKAKLSATMIRRRVNVKHGHTHISGGRYASPTYNSWQSAYQRCTNKNAQAYKNYGGRGIKVCERWLNSFVNFLEDMGERPEGKTLGRIDNNGNYEPSNCRWETPKEQGRNKRHCETCTCL